MMTARNIFIRVIYIVRMYILYYILFFFLDNIIIKIFRCGSSHGDKFILSVVN